MILSIFPCAYWSLVYLLWRNIYSEPLLIFKWVICLLVIELVVGVLTDISSSSEIWYAKMFIPFCEFSFHSLDSVLRIANVFNFDEIQFIYVFFSCYLHYCSFCSKFWNWEMWALQFCSFYRLFWLFWVPWISIGILGSACQFLQRCQLGFW